MQASNAPAAATHANGLCPIGRASSLLGDRWVLLILREATLGVTRFDDFCARLGIADNILATRLRRLVDQDVLVKVPYHDGRRERFEYRLTEAGADFAPVMLALARWGERHTQAPDRQDALRIVHLPCGGEVQLDQTCATCGQTVNRAEQGWIRPWHSGEPTVLASPVTASAGSAASRTERTEIGA
jgi:DNA-binding HxlR family transcriptional regulator